MWTFNVFCGFPEDTQQGTDQISCVCVWCLHAHVCCKAQLVGWKYHLCFISRNIKTWKTIQSIIVHLTKVTNNQENKLLETSLELQCLFVVFRCRLGFGKQMTFSIWCAIIVLDVGIFCDLGNAIFCAFPTVRIYIYMFGECGRCMTLWFWMYLRYLGVLEEIHC